MPSGLSLESNTEGLPLSSTSGQGLAIPDARSSSVQAAPGATSAPTASSYQGAIDPRLAELNRLQGQSGVSRFFGGAAREAALTDQITKLGALDANEKARQENYLKLLVDAASKVSTAPPDTQQAIMGLLGPTFQELHKLSGMPPIPPEILSTAFTQPGTAEQFKSLYGLNSKAFTDEERQAATAAIMSTRDPAKRRAVLDDLFDRKVKGLEATIRQGAPGIVAEFRRSQKDPGAEFTVTQFLDWAGKNLTDLQDPVVARAVQSVASDDKFMENIGLTSGATSLKRAEEKAKLIAQKPNMTLGVENFISQTPTFQAMLKQNPNLKAEDLLTLPGPAQAAIKTEAQNLWTKNQGTLEQQKGEVQKSVMENASLATSGVLKSGEVYRSRDTGTLVDPIFSSLQSLKAAGPNTYVKLDQKDDEMFRNTQAMMSYIGRWDEVAKTLPSGTGGQNLKNGLTQSGAAFFGAANTKSEIDALSGNLSNAARAFGERGVLTDNDVKRVAKLFGTIYSSKEQMQQSLSIARAMQQTAQDVLLGRLSKAEAQKINTQRLDAVEADFSSFHRVR